jgi:hypothetical protein
MKYDERRVQKDVVKYCKFKKWWTLKGNYEGKISGFGGQIENEMGYMKGSPDLTVLTDDDVFFVEFKRPATYKLNAKGKMVQDKGKGVLSEEQKEFQRYCERTGRKYLVCYSLDEFIEFTKTAK